MDEDSRESGRRAVIQAQAMPSLVDLARAGDLDAFESIVRSRMDAMYRLALAILGDEADAADAVQESFVAAWRRLGDLRDADRFEPWLQRIVVNRCRMALRSRARRRVREIPAASLGDLETVSAHARRDDAALLRDGLAHLDADQRAILALHHLEGAPVAEIAATLGIPVGTAKSRLYTARAALERALREEGGR